MTQSININDKDFERASKILELAGIIYSIQNFNNESLKDFIYVPSINLYVAKEKTLFGKNWFECNKELHSKGERMPTFPEFIEFLKYTKDNHEDIYNEIIKIKSPWRAEWIDADFKVKGKDLIVNYHAFNNNGKIVKKSARFDKNTLMKDKTPGISLEDYIINNHTKQGLPSKNIKSGNLYYWYPRKDNNSVPWFNASSVKANLNCNGDPSYRDSYLGVRAVRRE